MLDATFPAYSPGSRRLYEFEAAEEEHLLAVEIERTATAFGAAADAKIHKGLATEEERDRGRQLWFAIGVDLGCFIAFNRQNRAGANPRPVDEMRAEKYRGLPVSWEAKVVALRRELEARRSAYPGQVEKGQLTRDQAQQQLERLEAVHGLYWRHGFAFDGTRDELRALSTAILDHDVEQQGAATVEPAKEIAA